MASVILEYCYTFVTISLLVFFLKKTTSLASGHPIHFRRYIKVWAFFGAVFGAYSFAWLYTVYPLPWLTPGVTQFFGLFLLHFILISICALSYSVVGFAFHKRVHSVKKKYRAIIFALLLTLGEILRSFLVSLLYVGNGGTLGLHWTASTIGNALSVTPLIEYAYFAGTFSLAFIVGVLVYTWGTPHSLKQRYIYTLAILAGLCIIHYGIPVHGPVKPLQVGVITTNFPNPKKATSTVLLADPFPERFKKIHEMTKLFVPSSQYGPNIIVYPEDTRYVDYLRGQTRTELMSLYRDTLYIDSTTRVEKGRLSNYSILYNPNDTVAVGRGKGFIFPFSEYIPSFFTPIFSFFVGKDTFDEYIKQHTYTPIPIKETGYEFNEQTRLSTLLCSEILSYQTIRAIQKQKPSIVFFQSQLSVFNTNPLAIAQLRSDTKIAAAQLRTPIISSSNAFDSFIVTPYGVVVDTIPIGFFARVYEISKNKIMFIASN